MVGHVDAFRDRGKPWEVGRGLVALGSTGDDRAVPILEHLQATDHAATVFDGRVDVAAKKALRTLRRIQAAIAART